LQTVLTGGDVGAPVNRRLFTGVGRAMKQPAVSRRLLLTRFTVMLLDHRLV